MVAGERLLWYCLSPFLYLTLIHASEVDKFPDGFLLGFATASYQIEGAWNLDGKGENIWDRLTHTHPEQIRGGANGDVAADSYHKYKEDVHMLKNLNAQVYRFSLSWSRILPTGDIDVINQPGIDYYNNLIDELLKNGIQPMVTLYHWDLPQRLQDLGGWPNPLMADYFEEYARVAFRYFGDRVRWWVTFNEPLQTCCIGYGDRLHAPALDMSGIADYLCSHTILIAHARAYHVYDREFRPNQRGKIGISVHGVWHEPASNSPADREAAEARMQFETGWFVHPLLRGDYPPLMRRVVDANSKSEGRRRSRLPKFDSNTIKYLLGTSDFFGLNHYTAALSSNGSSDHCRNPSWDRDTGVTLSVDPSWPKTHSPYFHVVPWAFRKYLNWIKKEYGNIPVFVTENGYGSKDVLQDTERINFFRAYLKEMLTAIYRDKCNVVGYTAWSLMDNFEWCDGYEVRFGVYRVDFNSPNRTRTAKASVEFFRKLYSTRKLP